MSSFSWMRAVAVAAEDGIVHRGAFYDCGGIATVIHVHGKCGNFYENEFIERLACVYAKAGLNTLAVNNRGRDCISEAYCKGQLCYVGGALEQFELSVADIGGAVSYVSGLGHLAVLQGHSHGCEKVLWYLSQRSDVAALILLSPANSYGLQNCWRSPETVEEQVERLTALGGQDPDHLSLLPSNEYGVRTARRCYSIPTTRPSLIGWLMSAGIHTFDPGVSWCHPQLQVPAFAYIGGEDDMQLDGWQITAECVKDRLPDARVMTLPKGDHHMRGCETEVAEGVVDWMVKQSELELTGSRRAVHRR